MLSYYSFHSKLFSGKQKRVKTELLVANIVSYLRLIEMTLYLENLK